MTWKEFKLKVESRDITDDSVVDFIDITPDDGTVGIEVNKEKDGRFWIVNAYGS